MRQSPGKSQESAESHLDVSHLLSNLRTRTLSSGLVRGVGQGIQLLLHIGSTAALARMLTPEDFGLVAMVMTVMGFALALREMGLSTATIQRATITQGQVSNLFWINGAVGLVLALFFGLSSSAIAWFYAEPKLREISLALSATFLLNGFTVQHTALLNRQMRFVAVSVIDIASFGIGVAVGVVMAFLGYGHWALVAMHVSNAVLRLVLTWWICRWRPGLPGRGHGTRSLFGFGAHLTLAGLAYSLAKGCDVLLVGRFFGTEAAGLYSRASALLLRPIEQVISPVYSVIVPTLSRLQQDPPRYRRSFLQVFESTTIMAAIFTAMVYPLSDLLTRVLLGDNWGGAAQMFAAFSLAATYLLLCSAASWLFTSQGRGHDMMLANTIVSIVLVATFVAGLPFGPIGMARAYSLSGLFLQLPIYLYLAGRQGPVGARELWAVILRQLPVCLAVFLPIYLVLPFLDGFSPLPHLLLASGVGGVTGLVVIFLYPPARDNIRYVLDTFRGLPATHRA